MSDFDFDGLHVVLSFFAGAGISAGVVLALALRSAIARLRKLDELLAELVYETERLRVQRSEFDTTTEGED